jgi:gliding motility-associated-like protein
MNCFKQSFLWLLLSTACHFLTAQNILITYTKSDALVVCNTDTFAIQVQNNFPVVLTDANLVLTLPPGLTYLQGSVQGANEFNISNLSLPVFKVPDVQAGQTASIKILLNADCSAADVLDAGQLFIANISIVSALGNAQVSTTSIAVETGAIVIESLNTQVLSGEKGDTLFRTICVKNTRLGKIGNLYFEDSHQDGFEVLINGAVAQTSSNTFYSADFDSNLFSTVGNGDAWLDLNESVCLTERIILTSCGIPAFTNTSLLRIGWGCGGSMCRYDSVTAYIEIKPSTKVPDLIFEQIWAPPTDYCGNTPAVMGYKIKNIGKAEMKDLTFNISLMDGLGKAGMLANSFRIVGSTGTTFITPNLTTATFLPACNITAIKTGLFIIPQLSAKDSLQFLFDVITCVEACEQVQPSFNADFFYRKDCPVNGFVSGAAQIIPPERFSVQGQVKALIGNCLLTDQSYPFSYEAKSSYLQEPGFWHLKLDLPLGITFDPNCGNMLGNTAPVLFDTIPSASGGQEIHLAWSTPFLLDSLVMNFCLRYVCDTNIVCINLPPNPNGGVIYSSSCCFIQMKDNTYWTPALTTPKACGIQDCSEKLLGVRRSCVPDDELPVDTASTEPNIPVPGLKTWWNTYRTNLGYKDAQDDRKADVPWSTAPLTVRRDRFLAGDTLRVEFCGLMDTVGFVDTITRAIWHEITGSDMLINDNDAFETVNGRDLFVNDTLVRLIQNSIRVRYADGTEATCAWNGLIYKDDQNYFQVISPNAFPLEPLDDIATEKFFFLYSLPQMFADGCLPRPGLEKGDSIFILTDFKIDVNFKPSSDNDPDPPLVGFRTASSFGGRIYAWNEQPRKYLQYSGWKKYRAPSAHSIKPCEPSSEVKKFRYSMRIARENLFPFEVRPLAWISDYRETLPAGLELFSADLEYLTLQDSVAFLLNQALPFSQTLGFLKVDFAPAFAQPVDEGFTLRTKLTFNPDCLFNLPDTSKQYIETSFFNCLNGKQMSTLDSLKNQIGYFSNTPRIKLLTSDSIIYAPSRDFELVFDLKNLVVSPAPNAWVAVVSPSGQAADFELFAMPQNSPITGNNGFFNLGGINSFSQKSFRLKGQNTSCETDSLMLIFGWGCTPLLNLNEADCGRDTFLFELHLERPELELDILQEPGSITLCDTSDWFEFEVFNAKIGYAYNLDASVKLPSGLNIVPGTCQISYPEGSNWINIANPTPLAGNLFQWQINSILSGIAASGLPGVNLNPQNSFHIRFKTNAECGFVANSPIIYGTTGTEPCGLQSNLLNKPGEPLNIIGLNPSYGVQVALQPIGTPGNLCGDVQEFSVSLNILGTPTLGDSVYIVLPEGLLFDPNDYTPGTNALPGPPTLNALGFQVPLPVLVGGGVLQFSFKVGIGPASGCNDKVILAQTRVRTAAFCQTLGAPCEVFIATGEAVWNLDIQHPQLSASNATLNIVNGQLNGNLTLTNIGSIPADGAVVQVWKDVDGDGEITGSDILLKTLQNTNPIAPGTSVQVSGTLSGLDTTQLCGLLFLLPSEENCACDDQVFALNDLNLKHTPLNFCSPEPVTLGVPVQAGFTYQWQPYPGLGCTNCPNTLFTPDPNTAPNTTQILTLVETSSGCTVIHTFEISFGSTAQMVVGNAVICEGETTTLSASPDNGQSYQWQGPGIQNPAQKNQIVKPAVTSTYTVTITFSNGCTATDAAEIEVLQSDTLQLNGISTCAGEPVTVLGTTTATPGTYKIVLKKANGCDSTILQTLSVLPNPVTEEQRVFCFGDSLLVYDSVFTQSGSLVQVFTAFNGCDSSHFVTVIEKDPPVFVPLDTIFGTYGQIITLTGPDGFVTYVWQPAPTPPCNNCPSVNYTADSVGYHEYLLRVAGLDGCPGELLFRTFIFPPCSADSVDIPNAFTPNGDGANDVFQVVPQEGAEVVSSLEIYDRWGEKVYENQGNSFWDGTIRGEPAPSDVYIYVVKITCGTLVGTRVGDVTLLR